VFNTPQRSKWRQFLVQSHGSAFNSYTACLRSFRTLKWGKSLPLHRRFSAFLVYTNHIYSLWTLHGIQTRMQKTREAWHQLRGSHTHL